jgi:predicted phosphodiesterase
MRADQLDNLRVVLDALWRDLPGRIRELDNQLDFIAFTGDVAQSGKAEEYQLAEEHFFKPLLKHTGLSREQLFIVPGNHDVDWDLVKLINPDIPSSLVDRDKVTALLRDGGQRRLLFQTMMGYGEFARRFFGQAPNHPTVQDPLYSYVRPIASATHSVALVGLNSAWLSGFNKDSEGNVVDRGNLLIGDKQVGDAIREAEASTVRIALVHHPPSWLKEFDELDVNRWLRAACDFVLLGHMHVPNFEQEKALGRETINIPAGTVYKRRGWLNGYNLVQLNFPTCRGQIVLRRYSEERREWVKDVHSTGDELDGLVTFDLPGALGQPSTPIARQEGRMVAAPAVAEPSTATSAMTRVWAKIKPSWLRLDRERETQRLESFLQQDQKDTLWIWGNEGCGSTEFLQIARALLRQCAADVIYIDAEDANFGIPVDQRYLLNKLERWAGTASDTFSDQTIENLDESFKCFLAGAEERLAKSERRLVLMFANFQFLMPTVREWVWRTLWGHVLEPLREYGALAIFACEGPAPACPASERENRIYLAEFTVQDVERFLRTESAVADEKILELAREIHSGNTDDFLALPRDVYREVRARAVQLGLVPTQVSSRSSGDGQKGSVAQAAEGVNSGVEGAAQIFISYASPDREKIGGLYRRLSSAGFKPWMDKRDILPGERWKATIEAAIRRSDVFLACLSANSVDRRGVLQREIRVALDIVDELLDTDIYLIPVRLEACRVPENLRDSHWVNLFESGGWEKLVEAVREGIERRRGSAREAE